MIAAEKVLNFSCLLISNAQGTITKIGGIWFLEAEFLMNFGNTKVSICGIIYNYQSIQNS